mmetsp:Transcript_22549/g.72551  ORF Transcript_22549/g.72551 Transcript_22549/m.72551 type:complete len:490 (-) Transcript_22549:418-1887(-)
MKLPLQRREHADARPAVVPPLGPGEAVLLLLRTMDRAAPRRPGKRRRRVGPRRVEQRLPRLLLLLCRPWAGLVAATRRRRGHGRQGSPGPAARLAVPKGGDAPSTVVVAPPSLCDAAPGTPLLPSRGGEEAHLCGGRGRRGVVGVVQGDHPPLPAVLLLVFPHTFATEQPRGFFFVVVFVRRILLVEGSVVVFAAEVGVLCGGGLEAALSRAEGDLYEDDLVGEFGVVVEELFKCKKLVDEALGGVQGIDGQDEGPLLELVLEARDGVARRVRRDPRTDDRGFDADGADADTRLVSVVLDLVGRRFDAEDDLAAREEVAGVVVGLESQQIRREEPVQNGFAIRQRPIELRRRKGHVQKEAELPFAVGGAEHLGQEQKVVVLDPDQIVLLGDVVDDVRVRSVDRHVRRPQLLGVVCLAGKGVGIVVVVVPKGRHVRRTPALDRRRPRSLDDVARRRRRRVEQGPQHALAEARVEQTLALGLDVHRHVPQA